MLITNMFIRTELIDDNKNNTKNTIKNNTNTSIMIICHHPSKY